MNLQDNKIHLTCGVILNLISRSKKQKQAIRNAYSTPVDYLTQPDIFKIFYWLITGDKLLAPNNQIKSVVSKYKNCVTDNNSYLNFKDIAIKDRFYTDINNKQSGLWKRCSQFVDEVISPLYYSSIIKSLVRIIYLDRAIPPDAEMLMQHKYKVNKRDIFKTKSIDFEVFLINSIWHALAATSNTDGQTAISFIVKNNGEFPVIEKNKFEPIIIRNSFYTQNSNSTSNLTNRVNDTYLQNPYPYNIYTILDIAS